jgi:hypothetical protein
MDLLGGKKLQGDRRANRFPVDSAPRRFLARHARPRHTIIAERISLGGQYSSKMRGGHSARSVIMFDR